MQWEENCTSSRKLRDRTVTRFSLVEMGSNGEAQKVIQQFDGREFKGRALKVNEAKERESNRRPPRTYSLTSDCPRLASDRSRQTTCGKCNAIAGGIPMRIGWP
jgi:RNA recognition motif-containing protein